MMTIYCILSADGALSVRKTPNTRLNLLVEAIVDDIISPICAYGPELPIPGGTRSHAVPVFRRRPSKWGAERVTNLH